MRNRERGRSGGAGCVSRGPPRGGSGRCCPPPAPLLAPADEWCGTSRHGRCRRCRGRVDVLPSANAAESQGNRRGACFRRVLTAPGPSQSQDRVIPPKATLHPVSVSARQGTASVWHIANLTEGWFHPERAKRLFETQEFLPPRTYVAQTDIQRACIAPAVRHHKCRRSPASGTAPRRSPLQGEDNQGHSWTLNRAKERCEWVSSNARPGCNQASVHYLLKTFLR